MKKIIYQLIGLGLSVIMLASCEKDFKEINTDPINVTTALPQQLLAPALVNVVSVNMLRNRNFNNELMQVTVNQSDADGAVFRYDYKDSWSDYLWNAWYIQLTNFKDIYVGASDSLTLNKSYQGISLICQSWVYSLLTDTYGDVPYFESNQGRNGITEPKFDSQKDIYMDIFRELELANSLLSSGTAITSGSDPVYNGDVTKWRKFGNSLYLRLLLRLSGKAEVSDTCIAKIKEMVDTKSSSYPVMTSNADAAILRWTGIGPYTSPYLNNVRAQDFRSPAISSFFIDHLNNWQDPRINISTWGKNGVNRWGIAQGSAGFSGVPSGYVPGAGVSKQSYFYSYDQTSSGVAVQSLQTDPMTGMMMNYAELQFILAEAAAKGWISGSAASYYNNGILNSITLWLPNFAASVTDANFTSYVNGAEIAWNDQGTLDDKMEQIHLQKYYALFLEDMQQWFEYRRTGHPILPKGQGLRNGGVMPARMTYPVYVQSANPTSYKQAVAQQGADEINTNVWWQKP